MELPLVKANTHGAEFELDCPRQHCGARLTFHVPGGYAPASFDLRMKDGSPV